MKIAQFTGVPSNIRTLKDKSVKVTIDTQELDADDMAALFEFYGNYAQIQLASNVGDFKEPEVPDIKVEGKSPSTRLRGVLYVYYDRVNKHGFPTFDMFYQSKMEELINHFKAKLPIT